MMLSVHKMFQDKYLLNKKKNSDAINAYNKALLVNPLFWKAYNK